MVSISRHLFKKIVIYFSIINLLILNLAQRTHINTKEQISLQIESVYFTLVM